MLISIGKISRNARALDECNGGVASAAADFLAALQVPSVTQALAPAGTTCGEWTGQPDR